MLNLSKKNVEFKKLTKLNIEKELRKKGYNEYDLAAYYVSGFKGFNRSIKSDLRSDDHNHSMQCRIHCTKLIISDFGYKIGMSLYTYLLEKLYNGNQSCFYQVLNLIRNDFKLTSIESITKFKNKKAPIKYNKKVSYTNLPVKIEVKRSRDINSNIIWSQADIDYWNSYGISIAKVEEKGIAPLDMFWITNNNKDGIRKTFNVKKDLCYVYPFFRTKDGFFMYKIYLPNGLNGNPDFKWISNVNKEVIQNIAHIPTSGDLLIIQSSYKDIMLMEELNPNLNVIAPNGEGMWFDDLTWSKLKCNWKDIILFANNDSEKPNNPGLKFARRHSDKYNIPFVCTPTNTSSDISDYYKKYNKPNTLKLLNKILNDINYLI